MTALAFHIITRPDGAIVIVYHWSTARGSILTTRIFPKQEKKDA